MSTPWQQRMPMVLVTEPDEVIAAWEGELGDWDWYASDDETWVDCQRLAYWRATHWPERA